MYYKAGTPAGAWTANHQAGSNLTEVKYLNGYWVATAYSGNIFHKLGTDPAGAWTTGGANLGWGIEFANGYYAIVGSNILYTMRTNALPTITAPEFYYYMKVLP